MAAIFRNAPTLAWVLAGLTCFLVGAYVGEGWSRAGPPLVVPTVGVVVSVEVAYQPTATPEMVLLPTLTPTLPPLLPTVTPGWVFPDPSAADFPAATPTPGPAGVGNAR